MGMLKDAFRNEEDGRPKAAIMGVCSYIAFRLKVDVLLVRIATVAGAYLISMSKFWLAYITIGVILSMSDSSSSRSKKKKKKAKSNANPSQVKVSIDINGEPVVVDNQGQAEQKEVVTHSLKLSVVLSENFIVPWSGWMERS